MHPATKRDTLSSQPIQYHKMPNVTERIAKLEKRLDEEKALNQRIQARIQTRKRKEDTRRKILFGAILWKRYDDGNWPRADQVKALLDESLKKDGERALFNFPPLSSE